MLKRDDRNLEETEETSSTEKLTVAGVARRSWPAGGSDSVMKINFRKMIICP